VLIFTEHGTLPHSLRAQTQIARRCHHVRMSRQVEWEAPLTELGISELELLRTTDEKYAHAGNSILSYVCDRYFQIPQSFSTIAKDLGISTLEQSPWFDDPVSIMLDFFVAVCKAPDIEGPHKKRFAGKGYKLIERSDEGELKHLWDMVKDGNSATDWASSRQVSEKDWAGLLGCPDPVRFDLITDGTGQRVAVRFSQGPMKNPTCTNDKILVKHEVQELLK
jgi:hypothetical protein